MVLDMLEEQLLQILKWFLWVRINTAVGSTLFGQDGSTSFLI
jgi:hypothetical protein